eukprot:6471849-Amphidinium_carterae.1
MSTPTSVKDDAARASDFLVSVDNCVAIMRKREWGVVNSGTFLQKQHVPSGHAIGDGGESSSVHIQGVNPELMSR